MKKKFLMCLLMFCLISTDISYGGVSQEYINHINDITDNTSLINSDNEDLSDKELIFTEEEFENNKYVNKDSSLEMFSVPNDEYVYIYKDLRIVDNYDIKNFKVLGKNFVKNQLNTPIKAIYEQNNTTTVNWEVASEISTKTEIGNDFLGKLSTTAGVNLSSSSTIQAGKKFGVEYSCEPGYTTYLTAIMSGVNGVAEITYHKVDKIRGKVGTFTERVSGKALNSNAIGVDIYQEAI